MTSTIAAYNRSGLTTADAQARVRRDALFRLQYPPLNLDYFAISDFRIET
ncbi:MAG: hypothetical protein ABSC04_15260 [Syntrophobacteraceae bacterium]|jgi:hypothetical protein